jgi:hypothetical protein
MNEHFIAEPPTEVRVSRLPLFRARIETTIGVVVVAAAPVPVVVGVN